MMRIIAGTLVDLGRGRIRAGAIAQALQSGNRNDLGMTAPPDGLYLERVELDVDGIAGWP
jgi:tRNA pseudouridine38-40 synthase